MIAVITPAALTGGGQRGRDTEQDRSDDLDQAVRGQRTG
jgi:hypothetical protein